MRKLTDEQIQLKQVLHMLAVKTFENEPHILNEYTDDGDWRLARADAIIPKNVRTSAFLTGDLTIVRKKEEPGVSMPRLIAFSWRTKSHMVLRADAPIEFLED